MNIAVGPGKVGNAGASRLPNRPCLDILIERVDCLLMKLLPTLVAHNGELAAVRQRDRSGTWA